MSGMLKQVRLRPVYKTQVVPPTYEVNLPGLQVGSFKTSQLRLLETTTSFRSGPAYDNAIFSGAAILPDESLSGYSRMLGDTGHPFDHSYTEFLTDTVSALLKEPGDERFYKGPIFPVTSDGLYPSTYGKTIYEPQQLTNAQLQGLGSDLVNRASPIQSQADILQTVLELLREGLPSTMFSALISPKASTKVGIVRSLASDYLSHMFALAPLVRDLDKVLKAVASIETLVKQLVGDSGNSIYRQRALRTVSTQHPTQKATYGRWETPYVFAPDTEFPLSHLQVDGQLLRGTARVSVNTRDTRDVYFTGSFTYYLDQLLPSTDVGRFLHGVRGMTSTQVNDYLTTYLLGGPSKGSPGTLAWELTPFSWLVDWFVNVGTVLDNRRMFDELGLVMNYGYVMAREERAITTSATIADGRTFSGIRRTVRQRRIRANPFGFGVADGSLSAFQISILGALAIKLGTPRG